MNPNTTDPHTGEKDRKTTTSFGYRQIAVDEKAGYVLRHFNSIAAQYDFMNTLLSLGIHYFWKRSAVKAARLKDGALVIDVCGGTGDLAMLAAKGIGARGRVIVYDINLAMLKNGLPKIRKFALDGQIACVQGDAEVMAFPSDCFDAAMIGFGIRNVTHIETCLQEMYRVLKPEGRFMCLEFSLPVTPWFRFLYDFYSFCVMPVIGRLLVGNREAYLHLPESIRMFPSPDVFSRMVMEAGFRDVRYERLTNGIAVIYTGVKP
ncbi:MAG TPA: bifunctional demethylmenaquinone methyltransferase/2-methoxy-6-polyprenyl-1,4-benzoquinol methylase UbiE [Syntrophales bacterium]|mgnify:FL=1|nr:bifunctional demethylmenaquinone methyltransferase/2-methoxy-6-polyprenyl-1,4-benzoquinol methylase UbiE [Syntrophales bacterium]